ncbi:hypothetical protein HPHPP13_1171 [Helicobacter pylori Hp P-13]|uniref:Uncharacterized protein n=1 Tax=Helicobacter pylori Hp P-13b TaxID=992107 RepID=A0ABC9QRR1_HELPX|nr:hypothetical protein HPHPP13_1171 [Helicobacter pylori Hp P-13]EJC31586.1 hypothetical protein HPHPP13B_1152 [Helicobacter pylori Hp P-13b]
MPKKESPLFSSFLLLVFNESFYKPSHYFSTIVVKIFNHYGYFHEF